MAIGKPLQSALRGRCGACGKGRLFKSYLKLNDACPHCGQDFTRADTADGPAFFVGWFILIVFTPFLFLLGMAELALWAKAVGLAVVIALIVGVTLWLLPLAKAILCNLQIHHNSGQREHRSEE